MGWYDFKPYVSVAQRRAKAHREVARMAKDGRAIAPVKLDGRKIATTFWGKAWCDNLEAYSDFANRMPRGRTYVRNGSVIHLHVDTGTVSALVVGSDMYEVQVKVAAISRAHWSAV